MSLNQFMFQHPLCHKEGKMSLGRISFWLPGQGPEDETRAEGQVEYAKEKVKELSDRKPGDKYPLIGAGIGVIAGIVIGLWVWHWNVFWLIGCVIAGGIIGTLLGSLAGALLARYRRSKASSRYY